ncbi:unnamed protein product [Penicillium crustosum]
MSGKFRETTWTGVSETSAKHFTSAMLPLYHGPLIKIRLQPSEKEYMISKDLLCTESPVFLAMFKPGFREFDEQTATIQEMEDVVSEQSIEALIKWLYTRKIESDIKDKEDRISAAIELARLADKYQITGMESKVAQDIKEAICYLDSQNTKRYVPLDNVTWPWLTSRHIISGSSLPRGHPVRQTLAAACVAGYLGGKTHKFAQEAEDYPNFGADLLREVRVALNAAHKLNETVAFADPFDDKIIYLPQKSSWTWAAKK